MERIKPKPCSDCGTAFGIHEGRCGVCWKEQRDKLLGVLRSITGEFDVALGYVRAADRTVNLAAYGSTVLREARAAIREVEK